MRTFLSRCAKCQLLFVFFEGPRFVTNTPDDKEMGSMRLKPVLNEFIFRVRTATDAQVQIVVLMLDLLRMSEYLEWEKIFTKNNI